MTGISSATVANWIKATNAEVTWLLAMVGGAASFGAHHHEKDLRLAGPYWTYRPRFLLSSPHTLEQPCTSATEGILGDGFSSAPLLMVIGGVVGTPNVTGDGPEQRCLEVTASAAERPDTGESCMAVATEQLITALL